MAPAPTPTLTLAGAMLNDKLGRAVASGDAALASGLVGLGADVNVRCTAGHTAFHAAVASEHHATLLPALLAKADPTLADKWGSNALHHAARHGDDRAMAAVLGGLQRRLQAQPGARAGGQGGCEGRERLRAAVEARDDEGRTPLLVAAGHGALDVVRLLACSSAAADTSATDAIGATALHLAAENGHTGVVRWLCQHTRLDAGAPNLVGNSALHRAARRGHVGAARALLASGARRGAMNDEGLTAGDLSVKAGHAATPKAWWSACELLREQ